MSEEEEETAWLERMRRFLFEDPSKAAAEVVRFMNNGGAWDDFPFPDGQLPEMTRTVAFTSSR